MGVTWDNDWPYSDPQCTPPDSLINIASPLLVASVLGLWAETMPENTREVMRTSAVKLILRIFSEVNASAFQVLMVVDSHIHT